MPAILWAFFIAFLCGIPGKDLPSIGWLEMLSFDKFVHAGMFATLYFLSFRSLLFQSLQQRWVLILSCMAYGALLEILQGALFVDRSADVYDFIANSIGVLFSIPISARLIAK